jgi:glycosyltransferase involved in cell wall biosynthesis
LLVPVEQMTDSPFEPIEAEKFARDLADAINELMRDGKRRAAMRAAARRRAEELFSWDAIARQTAAVYRDVVDQA